MFRTLLVVLLLASSAFAAEPAADAEKLVGFWKPVSILCEGREQLPKGQADDFTLVIKDGEYRLYKVLDKAKDEHVRLISAELVLNPKLMTFEWNVISGTRKGEKYHGLYAKKDDQLQFCYGPADKPRPTQLESTSSNGMYLETWVPEKK